MLVVCIQTSKIKENKLKKTSKMLTVGKNTLRRSRIAPGRLITSPGVGFCGPGIDFCGPGGGFLLLIDVVACHYAYYHKNQYQEHRIKKAILPSTT